MKDKKFGATEVREIIIPGMRGCVTWYGDIVILHITDDKRVPIAMVVINLVTTYIEKLLVTDSYRRKGLATSLLLLVEEIAKEAGLDRVTATTDLSNQATLGLFRKVGYSELIAFEKRLDDMS